MSLACLTWCWLGTCKRISSRANVRDLLPLNGKAVPLSYWAVLCLTNEAGEPSCSKSSKHFGLTILILTPVIPVTSRINEQRIIAVKAIYKSWIPGEFSFQAMLAMVLLTDIHMINWWAESDKFKQCISVFCGHGDPLYLGSWEQSEKHHISLK